MYPTEITEEEIKINFELQEIKNPEAHSAFEPDTIKAVIRKLGPSDRIIKVCDPSGKVMYSHQRYGIFDWQEGKGSSPDWHPLRNPDDDPIVAIEKSTLGVEDNFTAKIIPKIPE